MGTPENSAVLLARCHRLWTRVPYLRRRLELLEVLGEALGQIGGHLVVSGLVFPRATRIEQLRRHSWTRLRNTEAEGWFDLELHVGQLAFDERVDHGPCVGQAHALANAVWPTLPAGVDQPALRLVFAQPAAQHLGIHFRRQRHERRAEAGGERRLRLGHSSFRTCNLRRIARHEVEHRLLRCEPGDRGQHAERVCSEKYYVLGMPARAGYHRVVYELHRIGGARVLGLAFVVVVGNARHRVKHYILQHRTEAERVPDLRLVFLRKPNALGIAAAFEVEDAGGAPAVLVIADQAARGIGRQRRLAGAGEAEEQRGDTVGPDVGRAMHRKNIALRQYEIHHPKDGFLHLARILRAADEHQLLGEIDHYEHFGVGAVALRVSEETGCSDDGELRLMGFELFRSGANEELSHEQVVPGVLVDHLDRKLVFRIGAAEQVLDKELLVLQVVEHTLVKSIKLFRGKRLVYRTPRHLVGGDGVLHGELIFRRTAGALAGFRNQRTARCQYGFAAPQRRFHQRSDLKVAVYFLLRKQLRNFRSL